MVKPRLLAVCYGGGHVGAIAPVAVEMVRRGWHVTTLALTTARDVAERHGLETIGFRDLVGDDDVEALAFGERLAATVTPGRVDLAETVAYMGLSYFDLVAEVGRAEARRRWARSGRAAFLPIRALNRALDLVSPDVVLTTNSPRAERAALVAAQDRGLATVSIIDLFGEGDAWVGDHPYTSYCVIDDEVAARIEGFGVAGDKVATTGNPAFDALFDPKAIEAADRLRVELGSPIVLAAVPPVEPTRFTSSMRAACERYRATLCLRDHPSTGDSTTIVEPGRADRIAENHAGHSLEAWLHGVDVMVSTGSTLGLQAAMVGTPNVLVHGWNTLGFGVEDLARLAPCAAARDLVEVPGRIDEVLAEPGRCGPIETPSTSATKKVAEVIEARRDSR